MKNEQLREIIRGLLNADERPKDITTTDMMLVLTLVEKGAIGAPVRLSHVTLGMELNVSDPTIKASVDRLSGKGHGWLEVKSGKGRQHANSYQLILDKLPVASDLKRTIVSPSMMSLAGRYANAIKHDGKKVRRFSKGNIQRMAFVLQQWLDRRCEGDAELLLGVLNHSLSSPLYKADALRGLHRLKRNFTKILCEYKALPATKGEVSQVIDHAPRMQKAAEIAEQLQAAIYTNIRDAQITSNWKETWPLRILTLLDAGHDAELISKVGDYASKHTWWGDVELGQKGVAVFVEKFDEIKASFEMEQKKASA
jgi:DNA-binding MarR family transcriptional regulator